VLHAVLINTKYRSKNEHYFGSYFALSYPTARWIHHHIHTIAQSHPDISWFDELLLCIWGAAKYDTWLVPGHLFLGPKHKYDQLDFPKQGTKTTKKNKHVFKVRVRIPIKMGSLLQSTFFFFS
jgi:hypothetical protein